MTGPKLPVPVLGRAALERVLARAAELQAASGASDDAGFTEEQLLELGREVGLPMEELRQALAEERAHVDLPADGGLYASLLGTATITAARTVPGSPAAVLASLDEWMQRSESLQLKRQFPDQLVWEPRRDFVSAMRRTLRIGGRDFHLAASSDVSAIVAAVDSGRTHVRLIGGLHSTRTSRAAVALVAGGAGVLVGLPLFWLALQAGLVLGATLAAVPAVALPLAAIALARNRYRVIRARSQVALEQALDRLEYGQPRSRSAGEQLLEALVGKSRGSYR